MIKGSNEKRANGRRAVVKRDVARKEEMMGIASFELWFYGGVVAMALAGLLLAVQAMLFIRKKNRISRQLDEEYGQPQKYNRKHGRDGKVRSIV